MVYGDIRTFSLEQPVQLGPLVLLSNYLRCLWLPDFLESVAKK